MCECVREQGESAVVTNPPSSALFGLWFENHYGSTIEHNMCMLFAYMLFLFATLRKVAQQQHYHITAARHPTVCYATPLVFARLLFFHLDRFKDSL